MSDPRRLLEGSESRLVAELLSAGRLEEPSPDLVERFARTAALGIAAGVVVESVVSTAAALGTGQVAPVGSVLSLGHGTAVSASGLASASGAVTAVEVGAAAGGVAASGAAASGAAAGGAAGGGALASGSVGGAALLKGGAASAVLAKWLAVGAVGVAAASATPQVLHWGEPREDRTPVASPRAAPSARADAVSRTAASTVLRDVPPEAAASGEPARRTPPLGMAPATAAKARSATAPPTAPVGTPEAVSREHERSAPAATRSSAEPSHPPRPRPNAPLPPSQASPAPVAPIALPSSPRRTLGAELARVDRARAALAQGDALLTLRELHGYEAAFPARQLALEVSMLRMEAYVQRGDLSRARDLAQRIVAAPVPPLHARRAREVLDGPASPP